MASHACLEDGVGCHLGYLSLIGEPGFLHMERTFWKGKPQYTNAFQASYTMFADKPSAKASHMAKPRVTVGGCYQEHRGRIHGNHCSNLPHMVL